MTPKPKPLTPTQRAGVTEALANAKASIEAEQEAPLDLDQATVIYDLCTAMAIAPMSVLDESLNLIDPAAPEAPALLELLDEEPKLLDELGRRLQ